MESAAPPVRRFDFLPRRREWIRRALVHTPLAYFLFRYRYLAVFTVVGLSSILLEVVLVRAAMPPEWPWLVKAMAGFVVGLVFSFVLNSSINFHVPREHLRRTFLRFCLVSAFSFTLNMCLVSWLGTVTSADYGQMRLVSSAAIFLIAYWLHRRYTFDAARNFGIAVYASTSERVGAIFARLGRNCDHVHVDLIDDTMSATAAPVDLSKIRVCRRFWPRTPLCLHLMTHRPSRWLEGIWDEIDWCLFHLDVEEDLFGLLLECRKRGKRPGVVWHRSAPLAAAMPYLPHVDFVMVLGISEPGRSGQTLLAESIDAVAVFDAMRARYGYEVMFDGGVKAANLSKISAKYIVSASSVLRAADPVKEANILRTNGRYARLDAQKPDPRNDLVDGRPASLRVVRDPRRKLPRLGRLGGDQRHRPGDRRRSA